MTRMSKTRAKPGARGTGKYFHVQLRPKREFIFFRNHDVGEKGGLQRIAGRRANGSWATQKWLIGKGLAHRSGSRLVADSAAARKLLRTLGVELAHLGGDRFRAE